LENFRKVSYCGNSFEVWFLGITYLNCKYAVHPLSINLQALVDEINGIVEVESPSLYSILSPSEVVKVRVFWLQSMVA